MSTPFAAPTKDPAAILVHEMDWSANWLRPGEAITSQSVTSSAPSELVVDQVGQVAGVISWRVQGGTVGRRYTVNCQITTSAGRRDERSVIYRVGKR